MTLDVGKACGPDGIGNKIIKMSTDGFSCAFSLFSNLLFSAGFSLHSGRRPSHITTSEREIRDLFLTLDVGKACEPDGIGNKIIKMSTDGFSCAFSLFSNLLFSAGFSLHSGRRPILFLYLKKMIVSVNRTIAQFLCLIHYLRF